MLRITLPAEPAVLDQRGLLRDEAGPSSLHPDPAVIASHLQTEPEQPCHLILNDRVGIGHGLDLHFSIDSRT